MFDAENWSSQGSGGIINRVQLVGNIWKVRRTRIEGLMINRVFAKDLSLEIPKLF